LNNIIKKILKLFFILIYKKKQIEEI